MWMVASIYPAYKCLSEQRRGQPIPTTALLGQRRWAAQVLPSAGGYAALWLFG